MLIIGFYLSRTNLKQALLDKRQYLAIALRLVVIPLCPLVLMYILHIRGVIQMCIRDRSDVKTW